ncbi:hypothetical protein [Paenibacillus camerounensis]|uniref:hypothetical protein n=1 Tax=Paenibacillus camerounensis TaxID=1243663 RepID=UPI0005A64981|nr:hypothetical protein [Paenibacillus camerounensis]
MGNAVNNLTEDKKAELIDKYGLSVEPDPSKDNLFQGDFGLTIHFPILISAVAVIVLLTVGVLLYFWFKKRRL